MRSMKTIIAMLATVGIAQAIGCASSNTNQQQAPSGTVQLPLTATVGANNYVLTGTFQITNSTGVTTTLSATSPSTAATLAATLSVGQYTITLLPGWQLSLVSASGVATPVQATLVSPATQSLNITSQQNTTVTYQFNSNGVLIQTGQGQLTVQLGVTENAGGATSAGGASSTGGSTNGGSSTGTCTAPSQLCGGTCVNLSTDAANCGSCGHSCGTGATCSAGQCQPVVLTSGLGGYSFVFGVDANYVYYNNCSSSYTCTPLRIPLAGGTATTLASLSASGIGVIGNTLLLFQNQVASFVCDIGTTCAATNATRFADGMFAGFKSPSPPYFSVTNYVNTGTEITTWYTTSNTAQSTYNWSYAGAGVGHFAQVGTAVYFAIAAAGGGPYAIWGTVGFPPSKTLQLTGAVTFIPVIADANSRSLILLDSNANNLYRVPLPGGMGTAAPQSLGTANATKFVTEDANGIYWFDSTGNVNRCLAPNCTGNTVIATGQLQGNYFSANGDLGPLYQDTNYLYWINGFNQLVKLAK